MIWLRERIVGLAIDCTGAVHGAYRRIHKLDIPGGEVGNLLRLLSGNHVDSSDLLGGEKLVVLRSKASITSPQVFEKRRDCCEPFSRPELLASVKGEEDGEENNTSW